MTDFETSVKIVLLGDSGVGKTSIVAQYVSGSTPDSIKPTVGAAFFTKEMSFNGKPMELLIWDTAGQEVYRGLAPMYYRSAKIAIIVFDVTNIKSFESVSYWSKELQENVDSGLTIVVCGNKTDLEDARAIVPDVAQKKAEEFGALYVETSASTGLNVERLFQLAINKFFSKASQDPDPVPAPQPVPKQKKDGCC